MRFSISLVLMTVHSTWQWLVLLGLAQPLLVSFSSLSPYTFCAVTTPEIKVVELMWVLFCFFIHFICLCLVLFHKGFAEASNRSDGKLG